MILKGVEYRRWRLAQRTQFADRLGLSRTPVREVLGRLDRRGLRDARGWLIVASARVVEDIMEILTVRRAVEGEAAEIAAGAAIPSSSKAGVGGRPRHDLAGRGDARHWSAIDDLSI